MLTVIWLELNITEYQMAKNSFDLKIKETYPLFETFKCVNKMHFPLKILGYLQLFHVSFPFCGTL